MPDLTSLINAIQFYLASDKAEKALKFARVAMTVDSDSEKVTCNFIATIRNMQTLNKLRGLCRRSSGQLIAFYSSKIQIFQMQTCSV